jgi:hypothetical protein
MYKVKPFSRDLLAFLEKHCLVEGDDADFSSWFLASVVEDDFEAYIREMHPDKWFLYQAWRATQNVK